MTEEDFFDETAAPAAGSDGGAMDSIGVPADDGDAWDDLAADRRGFASIYYIDTGESLCFWSSGYPTGAEAVDGWTVKTAWWRITTARRGVDHG
jgi:hypothetical protein